MKRITSPTDPIQVGVLHENESSLELTKQYLDKFGYQVTAGTFDAMDKLLRKLRSINVFVLFQGSDFEKLADFCMKASRRFPKAAILIVTNNLPETDITLLKKYGANSFLTQPITWNQLTIEIQNLFSLKLFEELVIS